MLCKSVDDLKYPTSFVDAKGKTCSVLMIDLYPLDINNNICKQMKILHYERCCGSGAPQIPQLEPVQVVSTLQKGPYPHCPLCGPTDEYPYNTAMVINLLYVGVGSCAQYWEYGESGWIQEHLCQALQYFAHEPCGCGEFNPLKSGKIR